MEPSRYRTFENIVFLYKYADFFVLIQYLILNKVTLKSQSVTFLVAAVGYLETEADNRVEVGRRTRYRILCPKRAEGTERSIR